MTPSTRYRGPCSTIFITHTLCHVRPYSHMRTQSPSLSSTTSHGSAQYLPHSHTSSRTLYISLSLSVTMLRSDFTRVAKKLNIVEEFTTTTTTASSYPLPPKRARLFAMEPLSISPHQMYTISLSSFFGTTLSLSFKRKRSISDTFSLYPSFTCTRFCAN